MAKMQFKPLDDQYMRKTWSLFNQALTEDIFEFLVREKHIGRYTERGNIGIKTDISSVIKNRFDEGVEV